jgi:hypothetical protein
VHARSHIERLFAGLPRHCGIVTVLDGHPATLGWLGAVAGHRVRPLGVEHFGQTGSIADLYRTTASTPTPSSPPPGDRAGPADKAFGRGVIMPIIDAQVHAYERNHPGRPWHAVLAGPPEVTGEQMVAAMDANGVDGAILISAFTMYRYDASYAVSVRNRFPGRFALIKPVDPANPSVGSIRASN